MTRKDFFKLPVADIIEHGCLLMPLESRYEPLGFADKEGGFWVKVLGEDDKLMRQQLCH